MESVRQRGKESMEKQPQAEDLVWDLQETLFMLKTLADLLKFRTRENIPFSKTDFVGLGAIIELIAAQVEKNFLEYCEE